MKDRLKEEIEDSEPYIRGPIERFKAHTQESATYKRFGQKLNITEAEAKVEEEDETVVTVRAQMDGYDVVIEAAFFDDLEAEVGQYIVYPHSDMKFSLSNILMALEVDDFNDYRYICEVDDEDDANKAADKLMDALLKYDYYIRKAGEEDNLKLLTEIKQADELVESRDDIGDFTDRIRLKTAASIYKEKPNEKTRKKYIAALERHERKFGLHTKEKRILEKLKSGETVEFEKSIGKSVKDEYSRQKFVVCFVICLIMSAVCLAALFIVYAVRSRNGIILFDGFGILPEVLGGTMLGCLLYAVVGRPMIKRNFEKQGKEIKEKYDKKPKRFKFLSVLSDYVMYVITLALSLLFILAGMLTTVMTENSVVEYSLFGNKIECALSQTKAYQTLGHINENDEFEEYNAPNYIFIGENGHTYWFGPVRNKKKQKEVERIFSQNGIEPSVVKTDEEVFSETQD